MELWDVGALIQYLNTSLLHYFNIPSLYHSTIPPLASLWVFIPIYSGGIFWEEKDINFS